MRSFDYQKTILSENYQKLLTNNYPIRDAIYAPERMYAVNFYWYIYKEENFLYLNGKTMLKPKVSEIINEYLDEDTNN